MLVLSRKRNQSIQIGKAGQVLTGPIVVTVVDVRGEAARLGIDCDRDLPIDRQEKIRDEESVDAVGA